jgi:hypothetical protein
MVSGKSFIAVTATTLTSLAVACLCGAPFGRGFAKESGAGVTAGLRIRTGAR